MSVDDAPLLITAALIDPSAPATGSFHEREALEEWFHIAYTAFAHLHIDSFTPLLLSNSFRPMFIASLPLWTDAPYDKPKLNVVNLLFKYCELIISELD